MNKQTNKLRIIYFIKFFADALFCGYLSLYFATFFDRYSWEYGLLLGVIPFCALLGNFLWGALSKNVKKNLMLIRIVISCEIFGIAAFTAFGKNFPTLLIFTVFVSLFNSPYFTLQDGLGSSFSKKEKTSYPSIRLMGSCGYLFALIAGAGLLKLLRNNYRIIFMISGILYIVCLILWFFIRPFDEERSESFEKVRYKEVITNKIFLLYFGFYLLLIGSHNVADSYLFARMSEAGITSSVYSLVFASEILFEIITMLILLKHIREKHYVKLLKISACILMLRTFLFGFSFPLGVLIAVAPLRGIGWGGFLSVHLLILRKVVSTKLVTKAISLLTVSLSLVNGLFTSFGTAIYSKITLPGFYLLLSGVQLLGIILLCFIPFRIEKENKKEVSK